jgi:predicted DNA-binding transcriptional regulator AlpA
MSTINQSSSQDSPLHSAEKWWRKPAVKERYDLKSDSTLYRWMRLGQFPKPEHIGPNVVAWRESALRVFDADPDNWRRRNRKSGQRQ